MKTVVTHISPDLDAIASSWLIKRYLPGWESAEHAFVPAGSTYEGRGPDADDDIIHVDTGLGKFDHHQFKERSSATKKVYDYLSESNLIKSRDSEAIHEMTEFVTEIDNFGEVHFPDPTNIRYSFCLHEFIYPLRSILTSDHELMSAVMLVLDSILYTVKNAIKAEEEIKEGAVFQTRFGKTLVIETKNEAAVKFALKKGYELVIRRDPENETVRIKTQPNDKYDLTPLHAIIIQKDPQATWFLHASKNMLLNGSSKSPDSVPSKLTLPQLIAIIKKV